MTGSVTKIASFLILILSFGSSAYASKVDISSPSVWADEVVDVPDEGLIVSSELRLEGDVTMRGGSVSIIGRGRIVAGVNSNVTIDKTTFLISGIESDINEAPVNVISMLGGARSSFRIKDSEFIADVQYQPSSSPTPWDDPPKYWLIAMPGAPKSYSNHTKLSIEGSRFSSMIPYSVGAIYISHKTKGKYSTKFTGQISNNNFSGFHGVIVAENLSGFNITGNRLVKNTFANIFAAGDKVGIINNRILYPGGGTTGDGITVIGRLTRSKIQNNTIFAGSCYGMLIKGDHISDLDISDNKISNGITTAIQVVSSNKRAKNIQVRRNIISSNRGFAVTLIGVKGSSIEDNDFSDNARGFPSQIYLDRSLDITVTKNMVAKPIGPEWASKMELNRSNVRTDDSTFTRKAN